MPPESYKRERNFYDKFICFVINIKNFFYEKIRLRIERVYYETYYSKLRNNKQPLISIYTPTRNRSKILIERAVKSVLSQSYKNFEYIIIGDGCTDDTENKIKQIKDKRIKFINIEKDFKYPFEGEYFMNHWLVGPSNAANTALKLAKGSYIARIDDWAIWTKNHLKDLLNFCQKNNYEFVTGGAKYKKKKYFGKKLKYLGIETNDNKIKFGTTQTFFYRNYLKFFKYSNQCWRKKINKVNDIDLVFRMYSAGVKMGFLKKIVVLLKPRPGNKFVNHRAYLENLKKNEKKSC